MARSTQLLAVLVVLLFGSEAAAFCGFFVAGGDAKLFNEASQVVLMRHGDKTALSMQNNYEGPAEAFAMVIPVPVVLQEENVKTLEKTAFDKIDQLTAPRLVEYWEQDPCWRPEPPDDRMWEREEAVQSAAMEGGAFPAPPAVKIEAQFKVGEYEIVILSATEATALDAWLKQQNYNIPEGAEPLFRPYIEAGEYFFVAKVDPDKVKYIDGRAVLSPLRFDYTSESFKLPVRLGMINSKGTQDLIVYILAENQRYEVANYKNVFIPTNIEVGVRVKENFGEFYRSLFAKTQKATKGVVVTEYAWPASGCDPCPGPSLNPNDFLLFGADEIIGSNHNPSFIVTRLHARYTKDDIGEDLVFEAAPAVGGGREWEDPETGAIEQRTRPHAFNNFQGRYIIRHEWEGEVKCDEPVYGRWGAPPGGVPAEVRAAESPNTAGPQPAAGAPLKLEEVLRQHIPEINVKIADDKLAKPPKHVPVPPPRERTVTEKAQNCAGCATSSTGPAGILFLAIAGLFVVRRRRRAR